MKKPVNSENAANRDELRHHQQGFGLGEGETCKRGQCVVQGDQSPLRAHAQMQEAFGGVTCSGQDVLQRAQAPAVQPGVPQKAVVTQVVIVVAHQDVEDHAFEKLCVVCSDNTGVAVVTHSLGEVGISLGARLGFVAVPP